MFTVLLIVSLFFWFVLTMVRARKREANLPKLPPPMSGALPIIDHTHIFITDTKGMWRAVKALALHTLQVGGVSYAIFGNYLHYLITDPEDALTAVNACLDKHFAYEYAKNWVGDGMVTGPGSIQKVHRKLLNPAFTISMIHGYLGVFNKQARKLVNDLNCNIDRPFNPSEFTERVILEIVCLTTFGSDIEDKMFLHKYEKAVDELMCLMTQRFQKPYLASNLVYKLFGYQKREEILIKHLHELSSTVIQQQKSSKKDIHLINNEETVSNTFLEFFIELSKKGLMSDKEIMEEIDTFVVATFDTTLFTLTIIMVLLGTCPEMQEKIYEEIKQVIGLERDVEKDDLQKLVYTKAVINESLRFFPTVPVIGRYVDKDVKLKNYTMRAGSQCAVFIYGLHRHSSWGPDADQFRPDRWLEPGFEVKPNCFGAFSLGKRSCIGKPFALVALQVLLIHLVRDYQWSADFSKVVWKVDITIKPASGCEIEIQRRTH